MRVLVVTSASHMIGTATKYLDQNGVSLKKDSNEDPNGAFFL